MPDLLIRGLTESTMARLKKNAARRGRSLQKEVRAILEGAVATRDMDPRAILNTVRKQFAKCRFDDSTASIREDRER